MTEYKDGDRVRLVEHRSLSSDPADKLPSGLLGTVIKVDANVPFPVLVEWDDHDPKPMSLDEIEAL